jgi:RNA polymerase sigma factor (sigma-70 family)
MKAPIALDVSTDDRLLAGVLVIARRSARALVDDDTAQDVAQDVALEFLTAINDGTLEREPRSLEAYVTRRARFRARDCLRGSANRRARESDWALDMSDSIHCWMQPDLELNETELAEVQRRTLDALSPACRRVFTMVRDGERTYDDVARTLGVSRSTICLHVSEAQRRFRHELHAYGVRTPTATTPARARARRTARAGSNRSADDRPWMLITLALAARSPPAIHPQFTGGTDADQAGQHVAVAEKSGSGSRQARRRPRQRRQERHSAEARRCDRRALDARVGTGGQQPRVARLDAEALRAAAGADP